MKTPINQKEFESLNIDLTGYFGTIVNNAKNLVSEVAPYFNCEIYYNVSGSNENGFRLDSCDVRLYHSELIFTIRKIKNKFHIWCESLWLLEDKVSRYETKEIINSLTEPKNIGVLTTKKIADWVAYYELYHAKMKEVAEKNTNGVEAFLNNMKQIPDVVWNGDGKGGCLDRNGIRYTFNTSKDGCITENVELHYKVGNDFESFKKLSNNAYDIKL